MQMQRQAYRFRRPLCSLSHLLSLSNLRRHPSALCYRRLLSAAMSTDATSAPHPVASSSQGMQIPALDSAHANADGAQQQKPNKKAKKQEAASQYPLEVRDALCAVAIPCQMSD